MKQIEDEKGLRVSTSEKMNLLMGSTLNTLANLHPDSPQTLRNTEDEFWKKPERLNQYRDRVIGFYNESNYYDVRVTKTLIMLHYLDSLAQLSQKYGAFDNIFSMDTSEPQTFSATLFYGDISRNHRQKMIPGNVTPQEFAQYLVELTQRYIPQANLQDGELAWLMPQNAEQV